MTGQKQRAFKATSVGRLRAIAGRLRERYGSPRHFNPSDPLDDLIFVALSRMTQEVKYVRTYRALRERMPTWQAVRDAPIDELAAILHDLGLAATKSRHVQATLRIVYAREGRLDLERLRGLSDEAIEGYLITLPGVSRKTARCVMLYALGRQACPVDAHVWRVMQRLGFAAKGAWSEARALKLEASIPRELRSSLHVTLVAHGRVICRARNPKCEECVLADLCSGYGELEGAKGSRGSG